MPIPREIGDLGLHIHNMGGTPSVRFVDQAVRRLFGPGIDLTIEMEWVEEPTAYVQAIYRLVPGMTSLEAAEAEAHHPAVRLPTGCTLVSADAVVGEDQDRALRSAMRDPKAVGRAAAIIAHEAGHVYAARHSLRGTGLLGDPMVDEGWARYVAGKLCPIMIAQMPPESRGYAVAPKYVVDAEVRELLDSVLGAGEWPESARERFRHARDQEGLRNAFGLALFEHLDRRVGFTGCREFIRTVASEKDGARALRIAAMPC